MYLPNVKLMKLPVWCGGAGEMWWRLILGLQARARMVCVETGSFANAVPVKLLPGPPGN